jgi:ectoine hydroxylase
MRLTDDQMKAFDSDGYLVMPDLFDADEVARMKQAAAEIYAEDRVEIQREKDGTTPRTAFAAHHYNDTFARVGAHPRLIEPAMQLLGGPVYIHQFKVNAKAAFSGDVWQWHQDYGTWKRDDDMPEARGMNLAIFLDEVTHINGPLMFIPGSHKKGVLKAGHDITTTSYPLWTLDEPTIRELADANGIVAPVGKPGTGLFFHGNLVHGSTANLTPWNRIIVYVSANRCDNAIRQFKRPEYIAHRDFTPVEPLADDCLKAQAAAE